MPGNSGLTQLELNREAKKKRAAFVEKRSFVVRSSVARGRLETALLAGKAERFAVAGLIAVSFALGPQSGQDHHPRHADGFA